MPEYLAGRKVCNLMQLDNKEWDDEILKDVCNDRDGNLKKKVPLLRRNEDDAWFWLLDDQGCFTVKSCYRALQGEIMAPHARFWRKVWNLKLPSKIVQFFWRVCSLCLPKAARLITKRVPIDMLCSWCRGDAETDMHVLFYCDIARNTWIEAGLRSVLQQVTGEDIFQVFYDLFQNCSSTQCTQIILICWSLWTRRNKWVWERVNMSSFGIKAAATNLLTEWRKAQAEKLCDVSHTRRPIVVSKWEKPQQNWVKINIDAALFEDIGYIGMGSIVRGTDVQFLLARSVRREGLVPPREVEALSLKEALSWLKDKDF
ncbi:uncharacterized protein LOC141685053 [Apium graveolens]|uniref:uncharacterized protein LOC141685053 n=1 Tax=Apium graveolens TaxID=4045 RepID=UPI003D7B2C4B